MTFHSCVQSNFFWYRILIDTIPICVHTRTHTFVNWQHVTITVAAMKDSCTRCSASKNIWTRPATWLHSVHENTVPITHSVSLVLLSLSAADDGLYWLKHSCLPLLWRGDPRQKDVRCCDNGVTGASVHASFTAHLVDWLTTCGFGLWLVGC